MKLQKRIIALILSLVLLCTGCLFSANALEIFGIKIGEDKKDSSSNLLAVVYCNDHFEEAVQCTYVPRSSFAENPGDTIIITDDVPLAFDHEFDYWEDDYGNEFRAGQEFVVTGNHRLYAVWKPKTDNDSHLLRVLKTAFTTFGKVMGLLFSLYQFEQNFSREYQSKHATDNVNA